MRRCIALSAITAVVGAGASLSAASASPVPEPGTWYVASVEWRFHDHQGVLRALDIDVTQHRTLTGTLTTQASVMRSICHRSGSSVGCGGSGPSVRHVQFKHDDLMSHASVVIRFTTGGIVRAAWQSHNSLPSGFGSDGEQCIPSDGRGSQDYSVLRDASVSAQAFGHHWGQNHLAFSYLGLGAGTKPPC